MKFILARVIFLSAFAFSYAMESSDNQVISFIEKEYKIFLAHTFASIAYRQYQLNNQHFSNLLDMTRYNQTVMKQAEPDLDQMRNNLEKSFAEAEQKEVLFNAKNQKIVLIPKHDIDTCLQWITQHKKTVIITDQPIEIVEFYGGSFAAIQSPNLKKMLAIRLKK